MDDRDRPAMRPDMGNDWRNPYPGSFAIILNILFVITPSTKLFR